MTMIRRIILWVGLGAFVLMGLFPPWEYTRYRSGGYGSSNHYIISRWIGYRPLFEPPLEEERTTYKSSYELYHRPQIAVTVLLIQWALVAVITGVLFVTQGKPKREQEDPSIE